ncbi:hypothetical protein Tco_0938367 [Tanacetum coccineum]|uniref:Uncharacterized protein n=1 Tax=Tanacetum coccineum TaxID=301880 RepID=A0ABQ5DHM7_9ASTR
MSSATSDVTYTSVYRLERLAFGEPIDEEYRRRTYHGHRTRIRRTPATASSPTSPDFIPGPENPQTLPVPQDEDELSGWEQPLPPIDLPTTESPGYVTESDPEEDPKEYEDDETEDGPVDYPMDGGDDGDDYDGNSSRDGARDEDEDEEEEH